MIICIIFGMAVSTVAAYIMVVTLAAPALLKMGVEPIVTHFCVFYWAMLSAITPPVAGVVVITASIAKANFLKTCWESMKLGSPKFIMPFIFVTYPTILNFNIEGFVVFIISGLGFLALSAGIQSGWGWWQQLLLTTLGVLTILLPNISTSLALGSLSLILLVIFWRLYADRVVPTPSELG